MLHILGQSINSKEIPAYRGVRYGRSSIEWASKPWACRFRANDLQRFEVRSGDRGYSGDANNGNERSELVTVDQADQGLLVPFGQDFWLSYAFMVEAGAPIISPFAIVGQMHDFHDAADTIGLSPPLCFVLGNTSTDKVGYTLQTRFDANPATAIQATPTTRWSRTITRGEWIRPVCRMRFGYQNDAQLQLWIDGLEVINLAGINIGFNHATGGAAGYWQYGIYRGQNANTLAVAYANMEQGFASLFDRVAAPLPIPDV